jgi:hypothetical protein
MGLVGMGAHGRAAGMICGPVRSVDKLDVGRFQALFIEAFRH